MSAPSIRPQRLLGGKIRLIDRIGRGGMGDVWVATNEATEAEVAVKTLGKAQRTAVHDERFRREARLAATISHRNVVKIFDLVDDSDGTLGLVMELLRGNTLEACLKHRGALSSIHALGVAIPVLSALHHVHQRGIVHRDVKPANVFFAVEPDGHVIPKVIDFGIAKLPAAGSALTMDGSVLGTPHYMSPEQIRGIEIDGRSDMFSMAVVIYEMLTGVRVFHRDAAAASLAAVLEHEVDPDPRIEPRVWMAIARALSKRPYERFATCGEFADALRDALDASDEEFTEAVQDLRPETDTVMSPDVAASGVALGPSMRVRKRTTRMRAFTLAVTAACGAAVLAMAATFAIMRPSRSEVDGETHPPTAGRARPVATDKSTETAPVSPLPTESSASVSPAPLSPSSTSAVSPPPLTPSITRSGKKPGSGHPSGTGKKPIASTPGF